MIEFIYHDNFSREITKLKRRFPTLNKGLSHFERVCNKQFHPTEPQQIVSPAKLHRLTQNEVWSLWKVELIVPNSGLRPNQWPRAWFVVRGGTIAFLCIASHIDNYNDESMKQIALSRISDIM